MLLFGLLLFTLAPAQDEVSVGFQFNTATRPGSVDVQISIWDRELQNRIQHRLLHLPFAGNETGQAKAKKFAEMLDHWRTTEPWLEQNLKVFHHPQARTVSLESCTPEIRHIGLHFAGDSSSETFAATCSQPNLEKRREIIPKEEILWDKAILFQIEGLAMAERTQTGDESPANFVSLKANDIQAHTPTFKGEGPQAIYRRLQAELLQAGHLAIRLPDGLLLINPEKKVFSNISFRCRDQGLGGSWSLPED
ncbi:MAG: hypothetical protein DWQ01_06755 [Planctomycetota bacterium]|nr:MAG: hypothetical protein DWQ01_06755 [Planctomycetota bacterium]